MLLLNHMVVYFITMQLVFNSVIIQWGRSKNIKNVNLPTSFSTTHYSITFGHNYSGDGYGYDIVTSFTTSGFTLRTANANWTQLYIVAGY